jgi:hypothetical protein
VNRVLALNDIIDFLLGLLRDPQARAAFEQDPQAALAEAGLDGATAQDVRDAQLQLADSGLAEPDPGYSGYSGGDDPVREISHTTQHFQATSVVTVDDRDTVIFQDSFNDITDNDTTIDVTDIDITAQDSFNTAEDNDVVAIQDNDVITEDNDVVAIQDNDTTIDGTPDESPVDDSTADESAAEPVAPDGTADLDPDPETETETETETEVEVEVEVADDPAADVPVV